LTRPHNLIPGNCYFLCNYYDQELLFPHIHTLQFIEHYRDEEAEEMWLFKEPVDCNEEVSEDDDLVRFVFPEDQLDHILEIEELQRVLSELTHYHPIVPPQVESKLLNTVAFSDQYPITPRVHEVIDSKDEASLHFYIRYTDNGMSLQKRDRKIKAQFYTHPLREADIDIATLTFFSNRGLTPETNYLADSGRTRILSYVLDDNATHIAKLIGDYFVSVYQMRVSDELVII